MSRIFLPILLGKNLLINYFLLRVSETDVKNPIILKFRNMKRNKTKIKKHV